MKVVLRKRSTIGRSLTLAGLMFVLPAVVQAQTTLPQGGSVVSGQARLSSPAANTLSITQNSAKAIIDWNGFSVGPNGSVSFIQPNSSSAILNRVTGSTSSMIAGAITGNGQVFLVNPNGIAITPSGTVQVGGGFVASTLDIGDADFNAGNFSFAGKGTSAAVSNAGQIASAPGGFVGLIGGTVSNSGTISVPLGRVGIGSGEQATIDPTGDGFLQVAVPTGAVAADGRALIDVSGHIKTMGGGIEIRAATALQAVRDAVNVSGALSARSVSGRTGNIVLNAGAGGNVAVSGTLLATGGKRRAGGEIVAIGSHVRLTSGAWLDAGSYSLSVGTLIDPNATITFVAPGTCTRALLHGAPIRGTSPSIPGMSIGAPPTNGGSGALNGLAGAFTKVNTGSYGSAGQGGRAPAKADPGLPVTSTKAGSDAGTSTGTPPAVPAPVSAEAPANRPVADASPSIAPAPLVQNDVAPAPPDRDAPVAVFNRVPAEVTPSLSGPGATLLIALAGMSLVLIAAMVGWLLRGSAWLRAFLASMLLWRLDPLSVVMRRKRLDQLEQAPADFDRTFDDSWVDLQAASIELGPRYMDGPGVRQGRRADIDPSAVGARPKFAPLPSAAKDRFGALLHKFF